MPIYHYPVQEIEHYQHPSSHLSSLTEVSSILTLVVITSILFFIELLLERVSLNTVVQFCLFFFSLPQLYLKSCTLLNLISFAQHYVCAIHPFCCVQWYCVLFILHLGCFPFLSSMDNAAVIIHATVLMHMCTYFSCVYNYTWNYQVIRFVCLSLLDDPKQFSKVLIYTPTSHVRIPVALCFDQYSLSVC